jgi:hypothetical protein
MINAILVWIVRESVRIRIGIPKEIKDNKGRGAITS